MKPTFKAPFIHSVLDVSLGHITRKDEKLLRHIARNENDFLNVLKYDFGYILIINMPNYIDENKKIQEYMPAEFSDELDDFSENFNKIFLKAIENNYKFIILDCDTPTYSDLEIYQ